MFNGIHRLLGVAVAFGILSAVSFIAVRHMSAPNLYAGDRIEQRTCRECGGKGKAPQGGEGIPGLGDQCPFCQGEGKVDVIIPGPNHPTTVRGVVVDSGVLQASDCYSTLRPQPNTEGAVGFSAHRGAIGNANLQFVKGDVTVEDTSGSNGLFEVELPPGSYKVLITANGFQDICGEITIQPLTEPIWQERANMIREPGAGEADRSEHGLRYVAAMAKPNQPPGGFVRSE